MLKLFGLSKDEKEEKKGGPPSVKLLVIEGSSYDWKEIMADQRLEDGRSFEVRQAGWDQLIVSSYTTDERPIVHIVHENGKGSDTIQPDFVLIRNEVLTPSGDYRSQLYGLMYAGVPSINSLSSIYSFCERPVVFGELLQIKKRLGHSAFPLIDQNYFSGHRGFMYCLPFPAVVKVGHAHAGVGKMKIANHKDMEDFHSVLKITNTYCTGEPYYEGDYDLRIQKIGTHYRAFKRISLSGSWKTNTGSSHLEEVEVTEEFKRWADEASGMFGGLDILTVDAIHSKKEDKDYILEVNGTSSGLSPTKADEDNLFIRELIVNKMNAEARAERAILAAKRVAEEQAAGAAAEERVAAATEEAAEARQAAEREK